MDVSLQAWIAEAICPANLLNNFKSTPKDISIFRLV